MGKSAHSRKGKKAWRKNIDTTDVSTYTSVTGDHEGLSIFLTLAAFFTPRSSASLKRRQGRSYRHLNPRRCQMNSCSSSTRCVRRSRRCRCTRCCRCCMMHGSTGPICVASAMHAWFQADASLRLHRVCASMCIVTQSKLGCVAVLALLTAASSIPDVLQHTSPVIHNHLPIMLPCLHYNPECG